MIALLWFRSAGSTISVSLLFAGLNVWPFHATLHTFCGTFRSSLSFPLKWAKGFSSIYFSMGCNCQISPTSICLQVVHTHLFSTRCCCCCCCVAVVLLLSGIACALVLLMRGACGPLASPCPRSVINSTANNNGNQEGPSPSPSPFHIVRAAHETHLACVNGIIVGGFGGCCGTISPRRGGPRCGSEISPADLNEITPVLSRLFEKRTRPP